VKFDSSPVTLVIQRANGEELWVGLLAEWRTGEYAPIDLELTARGETRWFPCASIEQIAPSMWQGHLSTYDGDGPSFIVRPTVEDDAAASITMAGGLGIPLPLAAIAASLESEVSQMPTLWAMSDDDGFVVTMMLNTENGLYVRYSSAWFRLNNPDVIDGLNATEVDDASLDMFDQFDQAGQMVALGAMRQNGGDFVAAPVTGRTAVAEAEPATVEEAAPEVKDVPILSSAADLANAIAAAGDDESLQWYVERRAAALGLDATFPWAE